MKYFLFIAAAMLLAGTALASDLTQQTARHKTVLKTSVEAQCSTSSGKLNKGCQPASGVPHPSAHHF